MERISHTYTHIHRIYRERRERAAESRNNRASCESQGIYLPYICHVLNCITRYVGFLYKMALRSHRLRCHRSICRGVLLVSSLISLFSPLLSPLLPLLSFIVSLFLYLAHTHTKILSTCTLSPYGSRTLPFIHNTHGTKS